LTSKEKHLKDYAVLFAVEHWSRHQASTYPE